MNVARGLTDYPNKTPAAFYLREMIETCRSVKGEENSAELFWNTHDPLGPFNLTVVDSEQAVSVHFYQKEDNGHHVRCWTAGKPLLVLNFRYGEKGPTNPTPTNSYQRQEKITDYGDDSIDQRLQSLLRGSEVNNIRTTSAAFVHPKNGVFETAFDNGYAGDQSLIAILLESFFNSEN